MSSQMIRDASEIAASLRALKDGQVDVINDRTVFREHGFILVGGTKNRRMSVAEAAEYLAHVRAKRWAA